MTSSLTWWTKNDNVISKELNSFYSPKNCHKKFLHENITQFQVSIWLDREY